MLKSGNLTYTDKAGNRHEVDVSSHRTVIVGNIPSFASGANPFFRSNMADGLLEVVDVPNMHNFMMAIAIGNLPLIGFIYKKYFLKSRKVKSLELTLDKDEFLQLDGEDLSGKVGEHVSIEYAAQVNMLALDP